MSNRKHKTASKHRTTSKNNSPKKDFIVSNINESTLETKVVTNDNINEEITHTELQSTKPINTSYAQNNNTWCFQYEAVVGLNHRKQSIPSPCQDVAYAYSSVNSLSAIIIADGAGSSRVSDIGARAVVTGIARFLNTLEKRISITLSQNKEHNDSLLKELPFLLVKHAKGLLHDLSTEHRRDLKDFRCTLLVAIIGSYQTLWLKVGDGALVIEKMKQKDDGSFTAELHSLGEVGKGEFANLTTFIDENIQPQDVQNGLIDSQNICAIFAMSDGAAEKLVSNNGQQISSRLSHWSELLRNNKLPRHTLTTAFYAEDFCKSHTGDDCSIAILSSGYR